MATGAGFAPVACTCSASRCFSAGALRMQVCSVSIGMSLWRHREEFLSGLALGLKLALIGLALACVIGLLVAFARTSRHRWLSIPAAAYVEFIRNIPLLLILFFLYFGVPMWAFSALPRGLADILVLDGENTTIVALAIYGGAYLAEVFRAGILGVGRALSRPVVPSASADSRLPATSPCPSCSARCCPRSATRSSRSSKTRRWPWPSPFPS